MDNFVDLFMVSPLLLVVLFFVAMLAGFIDALAGGGGLLTVPALLAAGMSPAQALATNKLQACGGSLSASLYFIRRKVVSLADQKLNILMTFIGSTSGALLVQHVQSDILRQILPVLVICIGLYFLLMPKLGEEDRQRRLHGLPFALIAGGCVGFYDGFFGPGAGSFFIIAFNVCLRMNLIQASALTKVFNLSSNLGSLFVFLYHGDVLFLYAIPMTVADVLGNLAGSQLAIRTGPTIVRRFLLLSLVILFVSLIWKYYFAG